MNKIVVLLNLYNNTIRNVYLFIIVLSNIKRF